MAEHKHGEMDTTVQEDTFAGFARFVARTVIFVAVFLLLLALVNG